MQKKLILRTDGGARGNPGPAAAGIVLEDVAGNEIKAWGVYLGEATNNQAEYEALFLGLQEARARQAVEVDCYLDSELVVKQLKLEYKVKNKELAALFVKVWNLVQEFSRVTFYHVSREQNRRADQLVNQVLDNGIYKNGRERGETPRPWAVIH